MLRINHASRVGSLAASVIGSSIFLGGCDGFITARTEEAWQSTFSAALIEGYSDFKGLEYSADAGVSIFSYRLPPGIQSEDAINRLRLRIQSASPCYRPLRETEYELQMRCLIGAVESSGFDEYRILVDPASRTATVMAGGFDSGVEISDYPVFEKVFLRRAQKP